MSIIEINTIDSIGTDKLSGEVILTITDHLDWSNEAEHLEILQEKLNSYIEFIEGGQIFEDYPNSREKNLVIEIVSLYDYNEEGKSFLQKVRPILVDIGVDIRQKRSV